MFSRGSETKVPLPLLNYCLTYMCAVWLFLFFHPVQRFPAKPENGDNHGKFCDCLVQDACQRTGHGVVDNPKRRVDQHAGHPDFLGIMGISCNGRGNICRDRENRDPAGPGENQGYNLKKADDGAHAPALGKFPFPSQAERAEGIDNIADSACHSSQKNQVDRIDKVG